MALVVLSLAKGETLPAGPLRRGKQYRSVHRSYVIDGEAIVCDDNGLAVFDLSRHHGGNARAILCTCDLVEINGQDVRQEAWLPVRSGRSPNWLKTKNPAAPAVRRLEEEDWNG
jgi:hypothetical protein